MTMLAHPVLQAVVDEAVTATGARSGVLVTVSGDGLVVAATSGPVADGLAIGSALPTTGARGYVLASGQPTALTPSPADTSNLGLGGATGVPTNLLVVASEGAVVLELADRPDGPFTVDHMDAVAPLAAVAAAATTAGVAADEVVPPARLGAELAALATTAPARYREVARAVEALLAPGR